MNNRLPERLLRVRVFSILPNMRGPYEPKVQRVSFVVVIFTQ